MILASEVIVPVALTNPPVNKFAPVILAPVIAPVALINPPVVKLPPMTLPVALTIVVCNAPVAALKNMLLLA